MNHHSGHNCHSYHNRHNIDAEDNIFNFIDNDDIYDGRNNTSDKESSSSSSSSIKKDVCVLKLDGYVQIWTWNTEHFINIFDCMVLDGQLVDLLYFSTHDSVSGSGNNNLIIVERSAVHFYTFQNVIRPQYQNHTSRSQDEHQPYSLNETKCIFSNRKNTLNRLI